MPTGKHLGLRGIGGSWTAMSGRLSEHSRIAYWVSPSAFVRSQRTDVRAIGVGVKIECEFLLRPWSFRSIFTPTPITIFTPIFKIKFENF